MALEFFAMENIEKTVLKSVLNELSVFLKGWPADPATEEYVRTYLFSRLPQQFSAHRIPLNSLSIVHFGNFYDVTVNFRSTERMDCHLRDN